MTVPYPRDMVGYGATPLEARWPGDARIALQFVINYEEGGENAIFHGDPAAEAFLSEWIGAQPVLGMRNMNMESLFEYGSRAGFWRLHRAFTSRKVPVTVYGIAMALERNPDAVAGMLAAGWEIASHGYRWIDYQYVAESVEREHIAAAIEIHTRVTGARPLGWYQGRCSPNTHRLVVEEGGFLYNADSYADDLPGIVKLSRFGRDGVQRARHHAAAVALRHCAAASDRKIRRVERETRCRCRLNVLWTAACMLRKRWAEPGDLKHCSLRSRLRTTWCEFSARLFCRKPCSWWQESLRCWKAAP